MNPIVADVLIALGVYVFGFAVFGRFEVGTPRWRRILKLTLFILITTTLSYIWGRTIALGFVAAMTLIGLGFHFGWCLRQGIHPFAATPRDKYYRLRGWTEVERESYR